MKKLYGNEKMPEGPCDWEEIFEIGAKVRSCVPYGSEHINDTYLLTVETGKRYILQKMNTSVFNAPEMLMENICGVTSFVKQKIQKEGGDPERETLTVIPTVSGNSWYRDLDGNYYRVYLFVEDTISMDQPSAPGDFYESGAAFGRFQAMLWDYPADTLHEILPEFHNTAKRHFQYRFARLGRH